MIIFNTTYSEQSYTFNPQYNESDKSFDEDFGEIHNIVENNYEKLRNKPQIENIELIGNKSFEDLGMTEISNLEILEIANKILYGGK